MFNLLKWWRKHENDQEMKKLSLTLKNTTCTTFRGSMPFCLRGTSLLIKNGARGNPGKSKGSRERLRQKRARQITWRYA